MSDAYEEQIEGFERDMAKLRAALADEQAKRAAAEEDLAAEREAINEIAAEMTGRWIEERDRLMRELAEARAALTEALDGWEYAAKYKGTFAQKHGDAEDIARLRKLVPAD